MCWAKRLVTFIKPRLVLFRTIMPDVFRLKIYLTNILTLIFTQKHTEATHLIASLSVFATQTGIRRICRSATQTKTQQACGLLDCSRL
jgi:hypothetical protein